MPRAPSSTFYISVFAHKVSRVAARLIIDIDVVCQAYRSLELVVEASNLKNVTCFAGNCQDANEGGMGE